MVRPVWRLGVFSIDLEQDRVCVAPQVAPALHLPQHLQVVVFTQRHLLPAHPGGHDGGQPGQDWRPRHQEPRHHLHVHEQQGEHYQGAGVDNVHETLPEKQNFIVILRMTAGVTI